MTSTIAVLLNSFFDPDQRLWMFFHSFKSQWREKEKHKILKDNKFPPFLPCCETETLSTGLQHFGTTSGKQWQWRRNSITAAEVPLSKARSPKTASASGTWHSLHFLLKRSVFKSLCIRVLVHLLCRQLFWWVLHDSCFMYFSFYMCK